MKGLIDGEIVDLTADEAQDILDAQAEAAARRKGEAKAEIDAAAEAARLRFVTPGEGQAMTYLDKAGQAAAIKADPDPDPADYPLLAASIGIEVADTGDAAADMNAVADIVLAIRAQWRQANAAIEAQRLGAKKAIDALADPPDPADVQAILDGLEWPAPE